MVNLEQKVTKMKNIDLTKPIPEILWDLYQWCNTTVDNMSYDENFPDDEHMGRFCCLGGQIADCLSDFIPTTKKQIDIKLKLLKDQSARMLTESRDEIARTVDQILQAKVS